MHGNTAIPAIEFGEDNDYNAIFSLLHLANKALSLPADEGVTYNFHLADGTILTGTYADNEDDRIVIALHSEGCATGERITVEFDLVERIVYA